MFHRAITLIHKALVCSTKRSAKMAITIPCGSRPGFNIKLCWYKLHSWAHINCFLVLIRLHIAIGHKDIFWSLGTKGLEQTESRKLHPVVHCKQFYINCDNINYVTASYQAKDKTSSWWSNVTWNASQTTK